MHGPRGRDAKQARAGSCNGTESPKGESVCCGESHVAWHSYYSSGSFLTVDTSSCKFVDTPKYFTSMLGNGYIERLNGGSSIYSPTSRKFRIYLSEDITHVTPSAYVANAYRMRIRWCGVGKNKGPKVPNVCCGTDKASWGSWWWAGHHRTNAGACEMKGNPSWITAMQGGKASGPQMFVGSNAGYVQNYKFNTVYLRQSYSSRNYWGHYDAHNFNSGSANQLNPKWCLFGETFPTGNMRVNLGETQEDEYPCKGIRLINEGSVVTNQAQICCGATDTRWKSKGSMRIYKDIDTSSCKFANDASNKMVYITSLGGNGGHWRVSGTTAYVRSSPKGFSMSLGVHNSQKSATYASQHGWYVNWCGIGKIVT